MKKQSRRKLVFLTVFVIALVCFVVFKQAQQTARVQPRYVIEEIQVLKRFSSHNGQTHDRQINVIVKDRWPFFAQPRPERTLWGSDEEQISYRYKGGERGGTEVSDRQIPPRNSSARRWLVIYTLPMSQVPKGATDVFLTAVITFDGNRSGVSTLPVKVHLR